MPQHKWPTLLLLALAELLGMSVWFSASAVVPALTGAWKLDDSGRAWLTMSVQGGFVAGAFGTGLLLAGVYPVGMKIMATWTRADRGLGIGLLVGALTLGSAAPHLLNAFGGVGEWRSVLYGSAALAALGGL